MIVLDNFLKKLFQIQHDLSRAVRAIEDLSGYSLDLIPVIEELGHQRLQVRLPSF